MLVQVGGASLADTQSVVTIRGVAGFEALDGSEIPHGDWLVVDQDMVDRFAHLTGDVQWIHVDRVRAAASPFGATVAHGFLTLSLIPRFWHEAARIDGFTSAINYGLERVRFPSAVTIPSRLRARFSIAKATAVHAGVHVRLLATIEREGGVKPVCVAEVLVRYHV